MPAQAPDRSPASDTDSELVQDDAVASTSDVASSPDTPGQKYPRLKKWVLSLRSRVRKWTNSRVYTAVYRSGPARAVRASLSLRSALAITVAALGVITVFGLLVSAELKDTAFESRRTQILEDAALRFTSAQVVFDQSTASTPDQVQEAARQVVQNIRASAGGAGAVSVVLLRSQTSTSTFRINQIVDTDVDALIDTEMRDAVRNGGQAQWKSVAIPANGDDVDPGILVGTTVRLPRAGTHELYIVYSLASDQRQVNMVMRVLLVAAIPLMIALPVGAFWMLFQLLRPVRKTADAAKKLAAGDLDVRLDVKGSDEMAQLSGAFNLMAESLQLKIEEYDELSQLQQRFVSDVSHELRTPLTTIKMADSVIWDNRDALPALAKRSAELLHDQTDRMDSLFTDLLEISRYDARSADLEAEMTDLKTVVARVIEANTELAYRLGVPVALHAGEERCAAPIDVRRIERVLRNLLVNALEFAEGTPVDITVAQSQTDVAVRVRDHGTGMSEETASHVFDRFFRADSSRKRTTGGTGLGLSISAEDVALHGGTLVATGKIGEGASFVMTLPKVAGGTVVSTPLELWEEAT